jgi:hypothetical protein
MILHHNTAFIGRLGDRQAFTEEVGEGGCMGRIAAGETWENGHDKMLRKAEWGGDMWPPKNHMLALRSEQAGVEEEEEEEEEGIATPPPEDDYGEEYGDGYAEENGMGHDLEHGAHHGMVHGVEQDSEVHQPTLRGMFSTPRKTVNLNASAQSAIPQAQSMEVDDYDMTEVRR